MAVRAFLHLTHSLPQLLVWISLIQGVCGDEMKIYRDVIKSGLYNPEVRPRKNSSHAIRVELEFELRHITSLDQQNQILYTSGFIVAQWSDDYLKWSKSLYEGIDTIIVPPNAVWLPDFGVINSANTFYDSSYTSDFRVHVNSNGHMIWSFGGNFATTCKLDLTYFPFDRQQCNIEVENWAYDDGQVDLHNFTNEVVLDDYHTNGEWHLEHSEVEVENIYYNTFPGKRFPKVVFKLFLTRKAGYYNLNIITPCFLVIILALIMFWLPAESGEKVSLGVTVVLALSVFQLVIADNSPKTSDFVPVLSFYVSFVMGMAATSTFVTIISLYFHHHLPNFPVPSAVKAVFFSFLARALCMKSDVPDSSSSSSSSASSSKVGSNSTSNTSLRSHGDKNGKGSKGGKKQGKNTKPSTKTTKTSPKKTAASTAKKTPRRPRSPQTLQTPRTNASRRVDEPRRVERSNSSAALIRDKPENKRVSLSPNDEEAGVGQTPIAGLEPLTRQISYITSRMKDQDKDEAVMEEWKALARVIDRLFFYISLIIVVGICVWVFTQAEPPLH